MGMSLRLHLLNSAGSLTSKKNEIKTVFDQAAKIAKQQLDLDSVDVIVRNAPENTIPELGVGGFTDIDGHTLYISLDVAKGLSRKELLCTMLHEMHHAKRFQKSGWPKDLAGNLVAEGLACLFEEQAGGRRPIYVDVILDNKDIAAVKSHLFEKDYNHAAWFFGASKQGPPRWFGYAYGYQICKEYLNKIEKMAAETVEISTQHFFNQT